MSSSNVTVSANTTYHYEYYCGDGLPQFQKFYSSYHGYITFAICIFGSIANLLNIIVLTRRDMRSPTNLILTGLAIADLLVMVEYIPYSWLTYIRTASRKERFSYYSSLFVLFHANFAQVCHTIAIWLTLLLAVWRYIAVGFPFRSGQLCNMKNTLIFIILGYVICPILCVPIFLAFDLEPREEIIVTDNNGTSVSISKNNVKLVESLLKTSSTSAYTVENVTLYTVNLSEFGRANDNFLSDLVFWIYSIVIKIIPCIVLTILSLKLICALVDAKNRRKQLNSSQRTREMNNKTSRQCEKEKQMDRITRMLLAVLLLFLLTEFPQGLLGLLTIVLGPRFFDDCYNKLGDVMDTLTLITSAINFIVYCAMSRRFRSNFNKVLCPRWLPLPQYDHGNELTSYTTTMHKTQV